MNSWLQNNDEICSTYNEEKSVVAERSKIYAINIEWYIYIYIYIYR